MMIFFVFVFKIFRSFLRFPLKIQLIIKDTSIKAINYKFNMKIIFYTSGVVTYCPHVATLLCDYFFKFTDWNSPLVFYQEIFKHKRNSTIL